MITPESGPQFEDVIKNTGSKEQVEAVPVRDIFTYKGFPERHRKTSEQAAIRVDFEENEWVIPKGEGVFNIGYFYNK